MKVRRLHPEDRKKMVELAKRLVGGSIRLEFMIARFEGDENWPLAVIPAGVTPDDYDMELSADELRVPTSGDYWLDVQIARRTGTVRYQDWEPTDWMTATLANGRLTGLKPHTVK